jgi:antitoxin component of MazEF toxin-antitoxin module
LFPFFDEFDWSRPMTKNLAKHGNSLALVLDRAILELVNIDPAKPVEISTDDGQRLIITPVGDAKRRDAVRAAIVGVNKKHGGALKRLAE